jgi:hypothetical protein
MGIACQTGLECIWVRTFHSGLAASALRDGTGLGGGLFRDACNRSFSELRVADGIAPSR